MNRFENSVPISLAAYNAGAAPILEYKGIPAFPETQSYVRQVLKLYESYRS
ncbi:MAG TPA: lytic transglycosylase domain-containing protein [Elusimicrobiota bacterium]|nr:lytic transglycosylase domain-containing protein [Elusimicrobiota bacterium]